MSLHVRISPAALDAVVGMAVAGYEAPGKRETIAQLFGRVGSEALEVEECIPYHAREATRCSVSVDPAAWRRRAGDLEERTRLGYLGTAHVHPDEGVPEPSETDWEDRDGLDPLRISIIAGIRPADRAPPPAAWSLRTFTGDYAVTLAAWALAPSGAYSHQVPIWTPAEEASASTGALAYAFANPSEAPEWYDEGGEEYDDDPEDPEDLDDDEADDDDEEEEEDGEDLDDEGEYDDGDPEDNPDERTSWLLPAALAAGLLLSRLWPSPPPPPALPAPEAPPVWLP